MTLEHPFSMGVILPQEGKIWFSVVGRSKKNQLLQWFMVFQRTTAHTVYLWYKISWEGDTIREKIIQRLYKGESWG